MTRIMVVDGSAVTRQVLARSLLSEIPNAEVIACENAKEALEQLEQGRFELITTALMLPDQDGLTLCRAIRNSRSHHYTPVIVVSGDADSRLLREGFEAGVTDYFDKSKGYKAFGAFIRSFIQRNTGMMGSILFAEDSATAATVISKTLERHGLKVTHVTNAEAALHKLEEAEQQGNDVANTYDLVITDFYLQGKMTGGDLLHAIRARLHHSQQEMPVLVLTSNDDQNTQVEVFHAGANDFVTKPIVEEILLARVRALLLIRHQYTALKQQTETMRWIAATDSLTGTRSKRYLVDNGEDYLRNPDNQSVWGLLIDIDFFKQINDTLGHITGDHVLADLGDQLNASFSDSMTVRFGGEEFCVLIPHTTADKMLERAEQLRMDVKTLKPGGVDITISLGLISSADYPDINLTRFLSQADKALYAAKERGRNRGCVFTPDGILDIPQA